MIAWYLFLFCLLYSTGHIIATWSIKKIFVQLHDNPHSLFLMRLFVITMLHGFCGFIFFDWHSWEVFFIGLFVINGILLMIGGDDPVFYIIGL